MEQQNSFIGRPVNRVDGWAKVTGQAKYSAEYFLPDIAAAALVESTIPAGKIVSIDTSEAEKAPHVIAVITHRNADRLPYCTPPERPAVDPVSGEQLRVLQDADIKFNGQPIGIVVAETQAAADYAASLVRVQYHKDPSPLLKFDLSRSRPASEAAAKRGRGPETKTGNADLAFSIADVKVDQNYQLAREQHNAMEPHATIAHWEGDHLTLWSKSQWVQNERDAIAFNFGISPEQVSVISPFVGGAFGSALRTWPHVTLAAMAAKQSKRPVRLELTRQQLFHSVGFRPRTEQRVALGATQEGVLTAIIHEAVAQTSTYEEFAEAILDVPAVTYACPNRRTGYQLIPMHSNTPCPMRGPGHVTGLLAQEIAMDELAVALGIDPIDLRIKNYAYSDSKKGLPWSSKHLKECYEAGAARFGWDKRNPKPRSMTKGQKLVGMGMATAINPSPRYPATLKVTVFDNDTALIECATSDMGPGTYTSVTQIAAEILRLPVDKIRFNLGRSDLPKAKEHGGSTTMASVGSAVLAACNKLVNDLSGSDSGSIDEKFNISAGLAKAGASQFSAEVSVGPDEEKQKYSTYSFGAVFAEVEVDLNLCTIVVTKIIGAYDAGQIINPKLARSQCIGGMVGGIGMALMEEALWDDRFGRIINSNLGEYLVPVNSDIMELDAIFINRNDTIMNPLGVKGVAELGLCGVAPAIVNAIWHATGLRMRDLPVTLDKLFYKNARNLKLSNNHSNQTIQ